MIHPCRNVGWTAKNDRVCFLLSVWPGGLLGLVENSGGAPRERRAGDVQARSEQGHQEARQEQAAQGVK